MGKARRLKSTRTPKLSSATLRAGIPAETGTRIRLARPEDTAAVSGYLRQAMGMRAEEDLSQVPPTCPSVIAALDEGPNGFMAAFAQLMMKREQLTPSSFTLLAEDPHGQIAGALVCAPPYRLIDQYVERLPQLAQEITIQGVLGISKIVGVAVHEDARGAGLGTTLVRTAQKVVQRCGCFVMYGSCDPHLQPFYRRLGFRIAGQDEPVSLQGIFGFDAVVSAPGQHIFINDRLRG